MEGKSTAKTAAKKQRVYCGPSVRGVARQYMVFTGDVPNELENFFKEHPAARALLVPVEKFAETRLKLDKPGSAEFIIFNQVKKEL